MKEIGREFPFIKDVLSSQVVLVIRELGQALTDYISAYSLSGAAGSLPGNVPRRNVLRLFQLQRQRLGNLRFDTYHGPRPCRGSEVARLGVGLARSTFAPAGRHFNTSY
jgi:hypothetical protein